MYVRVCIKVAGNGIANVNHAPAVQNRHHCGDVIVGDHRDGISRVHFGSNLGQTEFASATLCGAE